MSDAKLKKKYVLENADELSKKSIYLAGPTYRIIDGYPSWRDNALKILEEKEFEGIVYIPEYRNMVRPDSWTYSRQIDWEIQSMAASNIILFWIPRDLDILPAFTTNVEIGEWMKSGKITVGAPVDSPKNEYIRERCSRQEILWADTLEGCVSNALQKLKSVSGTKTFFTADTHFGEKRTLELSKRPFSSVEEMDWEMIANWNSVVSKNDRIYHLGDFGNPKMIQHLNFKSVLFLPGNYDTDDITRSLQQDNRIKVISTNLLVTFGQNDFRLIHEPENAISKNDFYLFGHIHKLQMIKENGLNVGIDCHDFEPISSDTVLFYQNAIVNHYDGNVFVKRMGVSNE